MASFHTIVAAVDFSDVSIDVLETSREMLRVWTEAAHKQLASFVEQHPIEPGLLTTAVLPRSPADAIVEYAEDQQADLIVLGSRGRGAVSRLLLGSVAERVLRVAGRSVLVVAHRDRHPTSFDVMAAAGVGS